MQDAQKTIALGDLLQKLALNVYEELLFLLEAMPSLTPELRTVKLKIYLSRTKKRMAQTYAICHWLKGDHIRKYLESASSLIDNVSSRQLRLNQMQDNLYFTHMGLYSRRTRPLEIVITKDILARGTYTQLPTSIFSCGLVETPKEWDIDILKDQLNTSIYAKLALGEGLPVGFDEMDINDGILTITKHYNFSLKLSLICASENSPWKVLQFRLLVDSHENELFEMGFNKTQVEDGMFKGLENIFNFEKQQQQQQDQEQQQYDLDSSVLLKAYNLCMYGVQAAAIRLLYIQALDTSRSVLQGFAEAVFDEQRDCCVFKFLFWKSKLSKAYRCEIRVTQSRPTSDGLHLQFLRVFESVSSVVSNREGGLLDVLEPADMDNDGGGTGHRSAFMTAAVDNGVRFYHLLRSAQESFTALRVTYLDQRMRACIDIQYALSKAGFELHLSASKTVMVLALGDVTLSFTVDSKHGSYVILCGGNCEQAAVIMESSCEKLASEINAIDFEVSNSAASLGSLLASAPIPIMNIPAVLQQMTLLWWATRLRQVCDLSAQPNWTASILSSAGLTSAGLPFELLSWEEMKSHRLRDRTRYDISVVVLLTVSENLGVSFHVLLCTSESQSALPFPPVCRLQRRLGEFGIGCAAVDAAAEQASKLRHMVEQALRWAQRVRVHFAASRLFEFAVAAANSAQNEQLLVGSVWDVLVIRTTPVSTASDEAPAVQQVLVCRSSFSEATLILATMSKELLNLSGKSVTSSNWNMVPKPSETALQLPWYKSSLITLDYVDGKVIVQVSSKAGVVAVSQAARVLCRVTHCWSRIRDMMRQLRGRQESVWMAPLGPNVIRVHGLHVTVSFYISRVETPLCVIDEGEPLGAQRDGKEHKQLSGADVMGEAVLSLGCLRELPSTPPMTMAQLCESGDDNIMEDNDPLTLMACLEFKLTNNDNQLSLDIIKQEMSPLFSYLSFAKQILNVSLQTCFNRNEHARNVNRNFLHTAVALTRPLLEFTWLVVKCVTSNGWSPMHGNMAINMSNIHFNCIEVMSPARASFALVVPHLGQDWRSVIEVSSSLNSYNEVGTLSIRVVDSAYPSITINTSLMRDTSVVRSFLEKLFQYTMELSSQSTVSK